MAKSTNDEDEENSRRRQTHPTDVDEDDDVGDPVNSGVTADENDEDAHQCLHSRSTMKKCQADEVEELVMMSVIKIHQTAKKISKLE
ncbi:Os07g0231216 [Oryza sativa Japonica Group]|uniref:Os07g0231216 protein n=1 Tax=Oryza sativa subsp. japonica TaxID=39947 RepID=A0A0P0X3Z8_ORYSJ|nr:Os07g0231216 [Oryza sativa Japonica Group]